MDSPNALDKGSFRKPAMKVFHLDGERLNDQVNTLTYLLTYSLTHPTEQGPSWEANRFWASQEIRRILWNP
jgi:hypothetical protein